jgi:hypothetical protein
VLWSGLSAAILNRRTTAAATPVPEPGTCLAPACLRWHRGNSHVEW